MRHLDCPSAPIDWLRGFVAEPTVRSLLRLVLDPEGEAEVAKKPALDGLPNHVPETASVELRCELSLFPGQVSLELLTMAAGAPHHALIGTTSQLKL
jgi:hypothetical protein